MTVVGIRPLSDEDLAILGLESETVAGHTCKVLVLEDPVDLERLREAIAARLHLAPELSMRLEEVDGAMCWTPTELDIREHVVPAHAEDPELMKTVAGVFERRLDRSRPLWRIDVAGGGTVLIWTLHHALADGMTEMRLGGEAIWDETDGGTPSRPRSTHEARHEMHRRSEELLAIAREAPHLGHHSPFAGQIDNRRTIAFATTELEPLREASKSCMATVNDAVLTVVGGGLRRWLEAHHDPLGAVRVKVPVSLHGNPAAHEADGAEPGNRDSYFCLDVPVAPADPVARLDAIRKATRIRKREHDAERLDALMRELGAISPRLQKFADRIMASPRAFALNISNVPGPRGPVTVAGSPVRAMHSIAEIGQRHALRTAVVSYAGTLRFGLCADPTLVADVDSLASEIEADAAELVSEAAAAPTV